MDVSNVLSGSHETELFVLLVPTEENIICSSPRSKNQAETAHLKFNHCIELCRFTGQISLSVCVQCSYLHVRGECD